MPVAESHAFVMADIAGSSRLWNLESAGMSAALARHDGLARSTIVERSGELFKHTGDGFLARFDDLDRAFAAMDDYQQALAEERWPEPIEIRSRVGVHWGPAEQRHGDWFGPTINHLARITDLVEPTHVVVSDVARDACSDLTGRWLEPLGSYGVRDVPQPVALYELPVRTARGPALTFEAGRGLPSYPTSLVGREEDLATVTERLESHRIVTVVGFGGTGKTRVAVEAGQRWARRPGRRAWFVDLTAADDPLLAIGDAIGLSPTKLDGARSPVTSVARHLGDTPTLLLLDNCEHVIDAAADLASALRDESDSIVVLATSREPLELAGEYVHPLGELGPPDAARLLVERAATAGIDDLSADVVTRLVGAVDALPLGIELVSARLRQVPPHELAAALADDLDALRSRRRSRDRLDAGRSARHADLRAVIEWSYRLLDPDERTLLQRLSRLPAPWPRTAAARLAPELDDDLVEELVAKSLLVVGGNGTTYRMLESVRQYGAGRLDEDPEAAAAADHALVDWATEVAPPVSSVAGLVFDPQRVRELDEQSANLRVALRSAARLGRHHDQAAIVTGLWPMVIDARARRWYDREVADALATAPDGATKEILVRLSLQGQIGEFVDADRKVELVETLERADPDHRSPVWAVVETMDAAADIIVTRVTGGDREPIRQRLAAVIADADRTGHVLDRAVAELFLCFSHVLDRETDPARALAERAGASARACNFVPLAALADAALAYAGRGDDADVDLARRAVVLGQNARWETSILAIEAVVLRRADRPEEASRALDGLVARARDDGSPFLIFDALATSALLAAVDGDRDDALEALSRSSITRTPLTMAILLEAAALLGVDPPIEGLAAVFDPVAFAERARAAEDHLVRRHGAGGR